MSHQPQLLTPMKNQARGRPPTPEVEDSQKLGGGKRVKAQLDDGRNKKRCFASDICDAEPQGARSHPATELTLSPWHCEEDSDGTLDEASTVLINEVVKALLDNGALPQGPSSHPPSQHSSDARIHSGSVVTQAEISRVISIISYLSRFADTTTNPTIDSKPEAPTASGSGRPISLPSSNGSSLTPSQNQPSVSRTQDSDQPSKLAPTSSESAELLATKWMNSHQLAAFMETESVVVKKGRFSVTEGKQVNQAVKTYQEAHKLTNSEIQSLIFSKGDKQNNTGFWSQIARAVPNRPIASVYNFLRRNRHPLKGKGVWGEWEDKLLLQGVAVHGTAWEKISQKVGRQASDCRDRYRNHLVGIDNRVTGPWSEMEENHLIQIITDKAGGQGHGMDSDVFWEEVSRLMDGRRGRQQCKNKWVDCLSKRVKNDGANPRWSAQDAATLLQKVRSLEVLDDSEIDWKRLPDHEWSFWSPHILQRRWSAMKMSVEGWEGLTHSAIVEVLCRRQPRF